MSPKVRLVEASNWPRALRTSPKVRRAVQREVLTVQRGVQREVSEAQREVPRRTSRAPPPASPRAVSPTHLATDRTTRASHGCAPAAPRASRPRPRPRPAAATTTKTPSASQKARLRRARLRRPSCRRRGCRRHCSLAAPTAHPLRTLCASALIPPYYRSMPGLHLRRAPSTSTTPTLTPNAIRATCTAATCAVDALFRHC